MKNRYSILILVALLSVSLCVAQYGAYEQPKKSLKSSAASSYLNKQDQNSADRYAAEAARSNALKENSAANKEASYQAGQNVNRNVNKYNNLNKDIANENNRKDTAFARASNKIYKDSYDKVSSSSDVTCSRLKRFERELKKTYYNANSYDRKVLYEDVQKLRVARAQLQSIVAHALKQAYIKSGYKNADSKYKTADDYKNADNQYANSDSSSAYKAQNANEAKNKGKQGYSFFLQQQQKTFEMKLAQLSTPKEESVVFMNMVQETQDYVTQVCDRYSTSITSITKQSCDGLKNIAQKGEGYDYCKQEGLAIGSYIKEGYLARKQLCHAGSSLKYLKQIYSGVYDLYSGYRSQYLNKVYGKIYARRKNLCAQDETHSQVFNSVVAKNTEQVSGKSGNKYGNRHNIQNAADREDVNSYENKFKKASGNQAAANKEAQKYYAKENKEGQRYGSASSTKKSNDHVDKQSTTKVPYQVKVEKPAYETTVYERPSYPTKQNNYQGAYSFLIQQYGNNAYEAPKYEAKAYEAPKYEAPAYEAPKYQAPAYEAPKYQAPAYEAPKEKVYKTVYKPKITYETKYHVYPKQYQKHTDYAKQLRKAYKSGYKQGVQQGNNLKAGSKSSSSYYYSGYFLQNPYVPKQLANQYADQNMNNAYKQGYKNGYSRSASYASGNVKASSYGNAQKSGRRCANKAYAPISTYQPAYGEQLKHNGHGVAIPNIYKQIPQINKNQCEQACESYEKCNSYGYQADAKLCNLYPNDLIGHIKAGLFTEVSHYAGIDAHKNYPVLHYKQTNPVEYCVDY